ncbi:Tim17-domain-containing protein [Wallemia mellicola]|uniref:Tim17-domain-containing protein n=1 Tax=Wallemia mellicola TaxID=1708541 RepID=A0A4T0SSN2_9BASI|nr:Tim17-domain-containing protein [Wallemia mellicola]TIB88372.1 Tim17-domain-containing protein [Wallemia mellicola]TIB91154.1 Tim17-domain-containing protein [Wallemia mellicola]TIB94776.1 Tim17-domain-containing protein [Wallemia mellicola]TIC18358.1 Tim17-domain-containing protein [Wallemia mellicola]
MWPFTSNTEKSEGTNVQNIEQNTTTTNDPTSNLSASSAQDVLSIDPTTLHPMADVGDKLDYLLLDDDKLSELPGSETALPSRGWTDDLCYGVGTTYVSVHKGLGIGGLWGIREGMNKKLAAPVTRLRINAILNSVTKRGSFIGNSGGVLALVYNISNSSLDSIRGKHDVLNSMGAGAISGALFKSTAGLRPMAISAGILASSAGGWTLFKRTIL